MRRKQASGGGGGGPAFRSAAATLIMGTGGDTVLAPADSIIGDQLFIYVICSANGVPPTLTGWTLLSSATKSGIATVAVYTRTAAGAGAANNAGITGNASVRTVATMIAVSGPVTTTTVVRAAGFAGDANFAWGANTLTMTVPAFSPGLMIAFAGSVGMASDLGPTTYSHGLTEVVNYYSTAGDKYEQSIAHGPVVGSLGSAVVATNLATAAFYAHGIVVILA